MTPLERLAEIRELAASGEARRIRRDARISAREMAEPVGVSHTTLIAWEDGRQVPRADAALRWFEALDGLRRPVAS